MKKLLFVRHAESVANAGGVTMNNDLIPLSPRGHQQAQFIAGRLPSSPRLILQSSFLRTQETAAPFCRRTGLAPQVHPLLHEFCTLDAALIAGMNLEQRRPVTEGYWAESDPDKRMGAAAETFHEFAQRVEDFQHEMVTLPDGTVIFGHGMWLALLIWRLLGFHAQGQSAMLAFRRFQLALPMPNCAIYAFEQTAHDAWAIQADEALAQTLMVAVPKMQNN